LTAKVLPTAQRWRLIAGQIGCSSNFSGDAKAPITSGQSPIVVIDLETTGLSRDAGTLAFMIGIAYFDQGRCWVEQWTLSQLRAEAVMLAAVVARIEAVAAADACLVSFNGRSFDLPLLRTRLARSGVSQGRLVDMPHLDLLLVARRLWRDRLVNCRLGTIESEVLGVRRRSDISGGEIPPVFWAWLQAPGRGDLCHQMDRIREHNHADLVSLVLLGEEVAKRLAAPTGPDESLRVARFFEATQRPMAALATIEDGLARAAAACATVRPPPGERRPDRWFAAGGLPQPASQARRARAGMRVSRHRLTLAAAPTSSRGPQGVSSACFSETLARFCGSQGELFSPGSDGIYPSYPATMLIFALLQLAARLYRQIGERCLAARCWATICEMYPGDPAAHAGLAKYLEHDLGAYRAALWVAKTSATPEPKRLARLAQRLGRQGVADEDEVDVIPLAGT